MMAEPTTEELDQRFQEASRSPRGDWGNAVFVIEDPDDDEEDERD